MMAPVNPLIKPPKISPFERLSVKPFRPPVSTPPAPCTAAWPNPNAAPAPTPPTPFKPRPTFCAEAAISESGPPDAAFAAFACNNAGLTAFCTPATSCEPGTAPAKFAAPARAPDRGPWGAATMKNSQNFNSNVKVIK